MKISRRKSLWTIIGGMFAPAVGESLAETRRYSFPPPPTNFASDAPESVKWVDIDPFWKQKEIASLQKIANGEFNKYQLKELENQRRHCSKHDAYTNSLKSVSEVYKIEMRNEETYKRMKESWKLSALDRIKELMGNEQ